MWYAGWVGGMWNAGWEVSDMQGAGMEDGYVVRGLGDMRRGRYADGRYAAWQVYGVCVMRDGRRRMLSMNMLKRV